MQGLRATVYIVDMHSRTGIFEDRNQSVGMLTGEASAAASQPDLALVAPWTFRHAMAFASSLHHGLCLATGSASGAGPGLEALQPVGECLNARSLHVKCQWGLEEESHGGWHKNVVYRGLCLVDNCREL